MQMTLKTPITRDDVTISSVRLFRPRAEDMRRIALAERDPATDFDAALATISRLTDLPAWAIEALDHVDLDALVSATDAMFLTAAGRH